MNTCETCERAYEVPDVLGTRSSAALVCEPDDSGKVQLAAIPCLKWKRDLTVSNPTGMIK